MRLLLSESHDPYVNLACEETLLHARGEAVFLWVNNPCVIVGRNQNPFREADLAYLEANGIALARRASGGGAVYQDAGNLNYSFISDMPCSDVVQHMVLSVLDRLGIDASLGGRNDIVVDGLKVGGLAQCQDERHLCHGTLLVSVDIGEMERALKPSPMKLSAHGIHSVRSRVTNLRELTPGLSVERVIHAFEEELCCMAEPASMTDQVLSAAERLKDSRWLYGESPTYDADVELRMPDGLYQFVFQVHAGRISSMTISTDSCTPCDLGAARDSLVGSEYHPETFPDLVRRCFRQNVG